MTIATARTRELDIGRICLRAFQKAGVRNMSQQLSVDEGAWARDKLGVIIDEMQAHGLRARAVQFKDVTLVAGQSAYTMETDVLDVIGNAMFIDPSQDPAAATGEIPVVMIGRDDWQLLSNKAATGRPTQYYVHRSGSPPELRLWPIPDANNAGTLRVQAHIFAADSTTSSNTVDLERPFASYLEYALAAEVAEAMSLPEGRVGYFTKMAQEKLELCKSFAAQRSPARFVVRHRTGWQR